MTTYDPDLLSTLLAVAQTGSFTAAAHRLGVGQPTVSQHVRRLEEAAGRTLVLRDTHSVSLTSDGEAMIGFARTILDAHEQAASYFSGARPRGRLRIGMSDDLALTRLPLILREFRRDPSQCHACTRESADSPNYLVVTYGNPGNARRSIGAP